MLSLSTEIIKKIEQEVQKYPAEQKQSAVMSALRIVQTEHQWLNGELIDLVAKQLNMPAIWVQEVATFYNMYNTKPVGKHVITVCTNLPCALSDGDARLHYLENKLGIKVGETTPCGKFTLKEGECMGACGDAPVLLVNNHCMHSFMTEEKIDQLLKSCD